MMKKIHFFVFSAVVAFGSLAASCKDGGGSTANVPLKTPIDTLSYAYGLNLAEQGLEQYLFQLGVLTDTTQLKMYYNSQIGAEKDKAKKEKLEKEFKTKTDSVASANKRNLTAFISGLKEAIGAPDSKSPYISGMTVGNQIAKQMLPGLESQVFGPNAKEKLNKDLILKGLLGALNKEKPAIPNAKELMQTKMADIQKKSQEKKDEELKKQNADYIAQGEKFLAENKTKPGIVTTASGLQYKVEKMGTGAKPTISDRVKVHYTGRLLDGTVFDSSIERKQPAEFGVGQVIKGWTEVLQLMPVGSKWTIYVPYQLAYGSSEAGKIKPFSVLTFDVELLSIEKAPTAPVVPAAAADSHAGHAH